MQAAHVIRILIVNVRAFIPNKIKGFKKELAWLQPFHFPFTKFAEIHKF